MALYDIAGLKVNMPNISGRTLAQARAYLSKDQTQNADFTVDVSRERIINAVKEHPELDENDWEYMLTGNDFYRKLIAFDGIVLHSSCISVDEKAFAFSAGSGVGKTTHTKMWLENLKGRAHIINDDKPAIRIIDGKAYACGTPWSGQADCSTAEIVPLEAICFLERSNENYIKTADTQKAIFGIFSQTVKKLDEENMDMLFDIIERIFRSVRLYELGCDDSENAFITSYNELMK